MTHFDDKPHEECGVIGIYNNDSLDLTHELYLGLYALQHRGQISCGIAVNLGDGDVNYTKGLGIVPEVFTADKLAALSSFGAGMAGIGHVRYSAGGFSDALNSQPFVMRYSHGSITIANNGSLVNGEELRMAMQNEGAIFQSGSDAELIGHMIARRRHEAGSVEQAIADVMPELVGAYSLIFMSPNKLVAVRDPHGFRPLCLGKTGESYVVASESCALTGVGASFVRDIEPGEVLVIDKNGMRSIRTNCGGRTSMCVFEYVYFSRPDSVLDGVGVSVARRLAGAALAREYPVEADVVVGVPDSGLEAAGGYADESGVPLEIGFIKNRYVGRTFIQDKQSQRERSVQIKLNPVSSAVAGKRVVLVDDSIVRGTTSAHIVELLRKAGAREVHMRISSPPFLNPCYFGTDISSREHLIACRMSLDDIRRQIGADSLGYISMEGFRGITKGAGINFCEACFTGEYPVPVPDGKPGDKFATKLDSLA